MVTRWRRRTDHALHGGDRDRDQAGPRAVAVDARSLAHAARRGGGAVIARALAGVLALWSVAAASVTDVRVDAYREAASAWAVGTVTGRAREERLKPGDVARPLLGPGVARVAASPAR